MRGLALGCLFSSLLVGGVLACTVSSSTSVAPATGIVLRAESLANGLGCGSAPSQLFKYVAVVYGWNGVGDPSAEANRDVVVSSSEFDCFADGTFVSLPAAGGSSTFRLEIYAFNRPAYQAAGSVFTAARTADPARLTGLAAELKASKPTWTTECTATQLEYVQSLANCRPLAAGTTGLGGSLAPTTITLDTKSFTVQGGQQAACGPSSDAGAALAYSLVRVRTRVGAEIVADAVVPCPAPYSIEVPEKPATYTLDVGLLDSSGNLLAPTALTECTAETFTGGASPAFCK